MKFLLSNYAYLVNLQMLYITTSDHNSTLIPTVNPPEITRHPENISVATGASTVFTVEATGDNLQFQWQKNGKDIDQDECRLQCSHADNISTLHIECVEKSDKGHYKCLVKNPVQKRVLATRVAELCVCEFTFYVLTLELSATFAREIDP